MKHYHYPAGSRKNGHYHAEAKKTLTLPCMGQENIAITVKAKAKAKEPIAQPNWDHVIGPQKHCHYTAGANEILPLP